ncbi:transposase-like protein DUF772 [Palleronia aestuarii]|uniref:Transposase-like protein DUF772 n=2 Tax=Palleronia aestuarii TaxID=568105 RepID=A0A2W7MQY6_9RHOB|nr:transposase-like protein DUF772 [Palleronia aestuarii]
MVKQAGLWSVEDRLAEISDGGDPMETLNATVDFEMFRPILERAAGSKRSPKGGEPAMDVVLKFWMLVLQSLHGMRFCGLGIADPVPNANTLWDFQETLIRADALEDLFKRLDRAIDVAGFIPRSEQIVYANLVAAPRQRNTEDEKAVIKAGEEVSDLPEGDRMRTSFRPYGAIFPEVAGRYGDQGAGF